MYRNPPDHTGTVTLRWLGQMGLLIRTPETAVCIDYFASPDAQRQCAPPIPAEDLKGIDAFLGTHDHLDHIDHNAWKIWAHTLPRAKFIFPRKHLQAVLADGVDIQNAVGLNEGGLYPYLQYVAETNGIRIHHAGDTVRYEGMLPKIRAFGRIDVQMLPINGRDARRYRQNCIGNMTWQEAADLAGETGPSMVIPGHWDMFADNSADPAEFADYLDAKYPGKILCRIPKIMEAIEIRRMECGPDGQD